MTVTQKELEEEIAKLSAFVNDMVKSSQGIIGRVNDYLEREKPFSNIVDMSKPIVKKKKLELEIAVLKTQLAVIERLIEMKKKEEGDKD